MSQRKSPGVEAREHVAHPSVQEIAYVVAEVDGVERTIPADRIVRIQAKVAPSVVGKRVKLRRGDGFRHRSVGRDEKQTKGVPHVRVGTARKFASRRPSVPHTFDSAASPAQDALLRRWDTAVAERISHLNYAEEFEKSGRQYSELDSEGNVIVSNARG